MARKVKIRRVVDGDTLEVQYGGLFGLMRRPFRVRLYAIDAPELAQPYGKEAREHLRALVRRGGIRMELTATDRYGRRVALLYRSRRRKESINLMMVRDGMAHWYQRYGGRELGFDRAEAAARAERRGIWRGRGGAQRPWEYRAAGRRAGARRRRARRIGRVVAGAVLLAILLGGVYAAGQCEAVRQLAFAAA